MKDKASFADGWGGFIIFILIIGGLTWYFSWSADKAEERHDKHISELFDAVGVCADMLQENLDSYSNDETDLSLKNDLAGCMLDYPELNEAVSFCSEYIKDYLDEYSTQKGDYELHNDLSDCMGEYFPRWGDDASYREENFW